MNSCSSMTMLCRFKFAFLLSKTPLSLPRQQTTQLGKSKSTPSQNSRDLQNKHQLLHNFKMDDDDDPWDPSLISLPLIFSLIIWHRVLSTSALSALQEFYADRDARLKQFEDLKNVAEEDDAERRTKVWSMDAFAEDWGESQFWVAFSLFWLLGVVLRMGIVFRWNSYPSSRGITSRRGERYHDCGCECA